MVPQTKAWPRERATPQRTLVPTETLHLLGVVLKTAFRTYCTGETVGRRGAWQLVQQVQRKLAELSRHPAGLVSEERLARFVEADLAGAGALEEVA